MVLNRWRPCAAFMVGLACATLRAQTPQTTQPSQATVPPPKQPAQAPPAETGLETPWDVQQILANLAKDNQQLQTVLTQLNPQEWYDKKGAPSTYIVQWQAAQRQLGDVLVASRMLSQKTDSLKLTLDLYFRLEALEVTSRSVEEGARKYADRSAADSLSLLIAHNFNSRERFREYVKDLAESVDQNFKIADQEAQRCRGMISREPVTTSSKRSKKD